MKKMNETKMKEANGGRTYYCPHCGKACNGALAHGIHISYCPLRSLGYVYDCLTGKEFGF